MTYTQEFEIWGRKYRYEPDNSEYPYVGEDNVRYRKHDNGGGLVASTATVDETVHVGPACRVFGNAHLSDRVSLTGRAQVGGNVRATAGVTFGGSIPITEGEYRGKQIVLCHMEKFA